MSFGLKPFTTIQSTECHLLDLPNRLHPTDECTPRMSSPDAASSHCSATHDELYPCLLRQLWPSNTPTIAWHHMATLESYAEWSPPHMKTGLWRAGPNERHPSRSRRAGAKQTSSAIAPPPLTCSPDPRRCPCSLAFQLRPTRS